MRVRERPSCTRERPSCSRVRHELRDWGMVRTLRVSSLTCLSSNCASALSI